MPLDRGIIDRQLQQLGGATQWWDRRELRDLPSALNGDEQILAISRGKIARLRWLRRSWLIVVTQVRVLCMRSRGQSWSQFDVRGDDITRVSMRIGPFHGRVKFYAGDARYRLLVPRADAYKLVGAISQFTAGKQSLSPPAPTRIVRRVVDHMMALPAAALEPAPRRAPPPAVPDTATQQRIDALEDEVQRLRQQVDFLEELLTQRQLTTPAQQLPESS